MTIVIAGLYWLLLWVTAPPGSTSEIKLSYPNLGIVQSVRSAFLSNASGVTPDANGLVAGLTIGVRDLVSQELATEMKITSLTHLVAVSGANLAIVMGAVYLVLAKIGLGRNWRYILALGTMVCYVVLVGPESSVIRAATMAVFVMLGLWLGRGTKPIYPLSLAIIFLLAIDPGLATDIGFALSAFATAGLTLLAQPLYELWSQRLWKPLALGLAATASAQLYTLPVLLYLQPSLPAYSLIANLLVEPVVAPVTILGLLAVLLGLPLPFLATLISWIASLGTQWIVLIAEFFANLPFARLHFLPGVAGIALVTALVGLVTAMVIGGPSARAPAAAGFLAALVFSGAWLASDLVRQVSFSRGWQLVFCDVGQGDALLFRSGGRVGMIDVGREAEPTARCLNSLGIERIDLLVLTHFDADHVGGIYALEGVEVEKVIISPFQDDRPLVESVLEFLAATEITKASNQLQGTLGDSRWKILSPSATAQEAIDSNDASVVVQLEFEDFTLLALGDLGERGQERILRSQPQLAMRWNSKPLVLKVAHHGSADQSKVFHISLAPQLAVFSVGKNDYDHPTRTAIDMALASGATVLRTDQSGSIAVSFRDGELRYFLAGKLTA